MLAEAVEWIVIGQSLLDCDKLPLRVTLEADEDKTRIEQAVRVHTGIVGVRTSKQPDSDPRTSTSISTGPSTASWKS